MLSVVLERRDEEEGVLLIENTTDKQQMISEHHFVFGCPAYCSIRDRFTAIFWGPAPTLSFSFTLHDHRVIAKFLHECFAHRCMLLDDVVGVSQH